MKITITSRTEEEAEYYNYNDAIKIEIEYNAKKITMKFHDGEPEDNNLSRNFNDVYLIHEALELAYKAGREASPLEIEEIESSEI